MTMGPVDPRRQPGQAPQRRQPQRMPPPRPGQQAPQQAGQPPPRGVAPRGAQPAGQARPGAPPPGQAQPQPGAPQPGGPPPQAGGPSQPQGSAAEWTDVTVLPEKGVFRYRDESGQMVSLSGKAADMAFRRYVQETGGKGVEKDMIHRWAKARGDEGGGVPPPRLDRSPQPAAGAPPAGAAQAPSGQRRPVPQPGQPQTGQRPPQPFQRPSQQGQAPPPRQTR